MLDQLDLAYASTFTIFTALLSHLYRQQLTVCSGSYKWGLYLFTEVSLSFTHDTSLLLWRAGGVDQAFFNFFWGLMEVMREILWRSKDRSHGRCRRSSGAHSYVNIKNGSRAWRFVVSSMERCLGLPIREWFFGLKGKILIFISWVADKITIRFVFSSIQNCSTCFVFYPSSLQNWSPFFSLIQSVQCKLTGVGSSGSSSSLQGVPYDSVTCFLFLRCNFLRRYCKTCEEKTMLHF